MALVDNLISYWKLDGDSIDSVASNDGTDTNITYSAGNGKIIEGAGASGTGKIDLNATIIPIGVKSISFWIKTTATGANVIMNNFQLGTSENGDGFRINLTANKITYEVQYNGGSSISATSTTSINTGSWFHVVGTYDGTVIRIYINGSLEATSGSFTDSGSRTTELNFFTGLGSFPQPYTGALDEVGIWSRQLDSTEISQLYNAGAGVQYPFSQSYTEEFTETITLVETQARLSAKALVEIIILSEVFARVQTAIRSFTETITLVDTIDITKIAFREFTETIILVDDVVASITAKIFTETIILQETISRQTTAFRSFVDEIILQDTTINVSTLFRTLNETIILTEAQIVKVTSKAIEEVITLTDTISRVAMNVRSFVETIVLVDTADTIQTFHREFSDTITLVENQIRSTSKAILETITLTVRYLGLINGRDIRYIQKYVNQAGTYIKKYLDIPDE